MSESLQLTTQRNAAVEKDQAQYKKLVHDCWQNIRRSGAQMIGWKIVFGNYLNESKDKFEHGEFENWIREEFGLADSTQNKWREDSKLFLAEMDRLKPALPAKPGLTKSPSRDFCQLTKSPARGFCQGASVAILHKKTKGAVDLICQAAEKICDGRSFTETMRSIKLAAQPAPAGGNRGGGGKHTVSDEDAALMLKDSLQACADQVLHFTVDRKAMTLLMDDMGAFERVRMIFSDANQAMLQMKKGNA